MLLTNRIAYYQVYQQTKERHDNNEKVKLVPRVVKVVAAQNIQLRNIDRSVPAVQHQLQLYLEKCLDSKNAGKNVIQHGHHLCHAFGLQHRQISLYRTESIGRMPGCGTQHTWQECSE